MAEQLTDESGSDVVVEQENRAEPPRRRVDMWLMLGVIGIALPIAIYLWFLNHFAVNVIFWDQWSDIYTVNHDWLNNLWAQHVDHRILFPNIVVVILADYTHLNIIFEEFISAGCLIASTALVVLAHRRRARAVPWLFYVPVVAVMLSLNQVQDTLWGFQLAWYMVLLSLAATIYVLDSPAFSWVHFGIAASIAVVGSFSSLMGLFIWPVGLFILLQRRRSGWYAWVWTGSALITTAIYFHGFNFNQPATSGNDNLYALEHPLVALKFILFDLGGSVGLPPSPTWLPILFGAVLLVVSVYALVSYGFRHDETSGRTLGVALIIFGLLFAASTTFGRTWAGLFFASRYNTFYFLLLVGSYLALVDRSFSHLDQSKLIVTEPQRTSRTALSVREASGLGRKKHGVPYWVTVVVVAVLLCVEVVWGTQQGIKEARTWSSQQRLVASVTLNINRVSNSEIASALVWPHQPPSKIRALASEAAARHLSLFGTTPPADVLNLERASVQLIAPAPRSLLDGEVTLLAGAGSAIGVSHVTFLLKGLKGSRVRTIGRGRPGSFVWSTSWDSSSVPAGSYELVAVAQTSAGSRFVSPSVLVRVGG